MVKEVALRLIEAKNFEVTVDPTKLEYRTRKQVVSEYYGWIMLVESLKAKYYGFMALDGIVIFSAFLFNPWFLLFLFVLLPLTLNAQFNWGDKLDDKNIWQEKFVTRVDGVGGKN
jgi:hypothetical protein